MEDVREYQVKKKTVILIPTLLFERRIAWSAVPNFGNSLSYKGLNGNNEIPRLRSDSSDLRSACPDLGAPPFAGEWLVRVYRGDDKFHA